ncbi:glucans biosynthesis glucosyltransferase MdoH [Jannaschia sp. Os4]|nr:glucans biosynthesis glucosyltransferase MdoH [Jannaschia sp. Os4]MBM2576572.1 glucans biosynthesis glucosyltransferase MdoH [Jannaschia sp. Os4]
MPPEAPLAYPAQDFARPFHDDAAPGHVAGWGTRAWRAAILLPALLSTGVLLWAVLARFDADGTTAMEVALAALMAAGVFWIALSLATATAGAVAIARDRPRRDARADKLDVALLMPIYEEAPWDCFGNAAAMLEALRGAATPHRFTLYVLSDTRDPGRAAQEEIAFAALAERLPQLHYRRRAENADAKVGNLHDWVTRWGGAHDAMLVLDADSLMSARAIVGLTDALSRDPGAGLVQSFPQLIGARTLFARAQAFANTVYGAALAEGLARWTGGEGNYWGHNAVIRTRAFAASAGLPRVGRARRAILSHDFVEAGLLRRAGWAVRFLPRVGGSYEETPPTLVDHCLRDRRWCEGNLQHLGLLGVRGMHAVSRFHLLQGAAGYLLSPLWFALLLLWTLSGAGAERSVWSYFNPTDPTRPVWPEMAPVDHVTIMLALYGMLLAPKLVGTLATLLTVPAARLGGRLRLVGSVVVETALSVLFAPILMVQQTLAVARVALGLRGGWTPQRRDGAPDGWEMLLRFHAVETALGVAMLCGIAAGAASPWLLPVAASLALAVPLSRLGAVGAQGWLATPQDLREPTVRRMARERAAELRTRIGGVPAE